MNADEPYLVLIKASTDQIFVYLGEPNRVSFLVNDMMKDACLTRLMVVGEYGNKISQATKDRFPEVEWQLMKVARNFYIHAYGQVNWERIWETITIYLPPLKSKIETIISTLAAEK